MLHRALAEAGLGHRDEALWHWHEALDLDPAFAREDLDGYGAPGRLLAGHPLRAPHASELVVDGMPQRLVSAPPA